MVLTVNDTPKLMIVIVNDCYNRQYFQIKLITFNNSKFSTILENYNSHPTPTLNFHSNPIPQRK